MERNETFEQIREWAEERGLYSQGSVDTQYIKLAEEFGEVGKAIINQDVDEFKDGLGDMVVVLVNLAHIYGTSLEECIELAWQEIKNRKGKMINGTFVKETSLPAQEKYAYDGEIKEGDELYMCIGLEEENVGNWANNFEVGKIYKHLIDDTYCSENVIKMFYDKDERNWFYVDASQFKLITDEQ